MAYKLQIEPLAKADIQEQINYYNAKVKGLGKKFHTEVKASLKAIQRSPFFQVRYDDVHCLPLKKYPAMIHYTINETTKTIIVNLVMSTHKDSKLSNL